MRESESTTLGDSSRKQNVRQRTSERSERSMMNVSILDGRNGGDRRMY